MPAAKIAGLGRGQHHHLLRYHQVPAPDRHEAHITAHYPLPAGCAPEHVRAALSYLVRRHEVLRTVYDIDARPWPAQRVEPAAPLPVPEVTTEDDGTPAPAQVLRDLARRPFDLGRDWPLRACMVTTGGRLRRLHLVFNHLSFDDVSLDALSRELDALLAARVAGVPVTLPPVLDQPADLARHEAAQPASVVEAALEPWRAEITRLPADVYARRRRRSSRPDRPVAHSASLTVPSLLADARAVAARCRAWPSAVHLAAYAVTMAAYTAEPLIACRLYTSQRDASGFHSVLTCMSYPTLAGLDLAGDPPLSEVVRRAAERVRWSMTHAHAPHDRVVELISAEASRRGQPLRVASEVNFLDNAPRSCRASRDRLTWNATPREWAGAGSDLYFRIYEWCDGITLALQAMDEVMDRDAVERFLRGYAGLLAAHRDPGADLRVSQAAGLAGFPPAPGRPLLRAGPDAVDPEQVALALGTHPAVRSARLEHGSRGLVAHVRADRAVTPAELRLHALGAVPDYPAARCPDWFEITGPGPLDGAGDGRPTPPWPPRTAAERALARAVAEVNGLAAVDLAASYGQAGGRALRLPAVLAALAGQGWAGTDLRDLAGPRPLGTIAGRLAPGPAA
jgi:hypothetical protein